MPESIKGINQLISYNDFKIGQHIMIFICDILVFNHVITEENISMVEKYINNGCKYYIKKNN